MSDKKVDVTPVPFLPDIVINMIMEGNVQVFSADGDLSEAVPVKRLQIAAKSKEAFLRSMSTAAEQIAVQVWGQEKSKDDGEDRS